MASKKSLVTTTIFATFVLSLCLFGAGIPCRAQAGPPSAEDEYAFGTNALKPWVVGDSVPTGQPAMGDSVATGQPPMPMGDPAASDAPQASATGADDGWHFAVMPYIWFAGVHGTAEGPRGNGLGFRASPSDLLSHADIGLMAAVEARHKWLVTSMDLMWIKLTDTKAVPFPGLGATSANVTFNQFFLTPKVGARVINDEHIKVEVLAGFRYWHFGDSLNFNPPTLGLNFSGNHNFVDPLAGGRVILPISPKIAVNILGDVGGWGVGSQLEYQWVALLGYRIKPAFTLQAGYRYLNIDYRTGRNFTLNATEAGVVVGAILTLK
jgi:hypothetical protein